MPTCTKCPTKQSKLNRGDLCATCFKNEGGSDNSLTTITTPDNIAGISLADIEEIPELSTNDLAQPITTGAMLKIIAGAMKPIHEKLADHERRIVKLEHGQVENAANVSKVENDLKRTDKRLTVTETKIKNLEEANRKMKSVVTKQQSRIANQDKKERLRNVVIAGLSETEPLVPNGCYNR